ncbi:Alpha/beta hydrolase fold-1 [Nemania sp. FL0916]|nr:Alpha/beta hydrolase fold-1 [Nemania sp. FL0916]
MTNNLSLIIVPAASALPLFYETVVEEVSRHGYSIEVLHIPSVGLADGARPGAPPTMYDDATFISNHVRGLADTGRDIILFTHSYGGTPATQSVQGLSRSERRTQGKHGGVVSLAYMNSLVPEVGEAASPSTGTAPPGEQPWMAIGADGWFYYPDLPRAAQIVFSDLPLEEGIHWAEKMAKHSAASFKTELTYGGYKDVPVSYLVAEADHSITPAVQWSQIAMIERVSGSKVDVSTVQSDHAPSISHPQAVVDYILRVAQKFV